MASFLHSLLIYILCNNYSFLRGKRFLSTMMTSSANNLISDLPKGPLDAYRKRATFNWKSFKLALYGENSLEQQVYTKQMLIFLSDNLKL